MVQSESDISADDPSSRLWQQLEQEMFGSSHPYAHPILGWPKDVAAITQPMMRDFYNRHYYPNHATLVMSGDITGVWMR